MGGEDPELFAMRTILNALESLDSKYEKTRVLNWIVDRLDLIDKRIKVEFDNKDD